MRENPIPFQWYFLRRVIEAVVLIFCVITMTFLMIHLAPGDPVYILAGEFSTPEWIERTRHYYGLDRPIYEQFFIYLRSVLSGDLGWSYRYSRSVVDAILPRIPNTMLLMGSALLFASLFGILLGTTASRKPRSGTDYAVTMMSLFGYSVPAFWLAQILVIVFALYLKLLPPFGMTSVLMSADPGTYLADLISHLMLPAFTLGVIELAFISRLTRASMVEELSKDYVTTARSKGLSENVVVFKHALKNALPPIVTLITLEFGSIMAGAVLVETVFAWPGLGRLMYESVGSRDYPVLMGMFIFISIFVIVANVIADILYAVIDPRVRYK